MRGINSKKKTNAKYKTDFNDPFFSSAISDLLVLLSQYSQLDQLNYVQFSKRC
uniref:Uncharacterized protein n=1 Tax=Tetranychus urticae TaxID=32264 RepID=T1L3K4_TETUR